MNNRLNLMRIYLVGPMDFDREAGKPWRKEMSDWLLRRGALPIDPYIKPLQSIHKEALEDDDGYLYRKKCLDMMEKFPHNAHWKKHMRNSMKPVVHTDLRIVDNSDCIICHLDKDKEPCGTFDEIFTAANQNKPIIIHCPQKVNKIYDWLWGRLPYELFFDKWCDVKEYLRHIDEDEDSKINLLDRWKFFDWGGLTAQATEMNNRRLKNVRNI